MSIDAINSCELAPIAVADIITYSPPPPPIQAAVISYQSQPLVARCPTQPSHKKVASKLLKAGLAPDQGLGPHCLSVEEGRGWDAQARRVQDLCPQPGIIIAWAKVGAPQKWLGAAQSG